MAYVLNLSPVKLPYGLSRGTALHSIFEGVGKGRTLEQILDFLRAKGPLVEGGKVLDEPIEETTIRTALGLYNAYVSEQPPYKLVETEFEFECPIEGSPHSMVGKVDQIVEYEGELWVTDFKSGHPKTSYTTKVKEWGEMSSPNFYIAGARHAGFDVKGMRVHYIVEGTPPKIFPGIEVVRSERELELHKIAVHQTCETLLSFLDTYGPHTPWPHRPHWTCGGREKCEYGRVCGVCDPRSELVDIEREFKTRVEHLELMEKEG